MNTNSNSNSYKVGGVVPLDNPIYVKRRADDELYNSLKAGEFCYVLNSRQMGKSSLLIRTMRRLESEGFACANIDVSGDIGTDLENPKQWYDTVFDIIVDRFNLDFPDWWSDCQSLSSLRRFSKFIENFLLQEIQKDIIIFVDEVDSVLGLQFKIDDFFKFIRACYNKRSSEPEYKRLTFALFGVATPSDLIQDKKVTPFNIGKAIELQGFEFDEAQPLVQGLVGKVQNPQKILKAILDWTGGQPFLTQKLCHLVSTSSSISTNNEISWLNHLVHSNVIEDWESHDNPEHLRTIHNRIIANKQNALYLLELYLRILSKEKIKADDSQKQIELRLSGLVVKRTGRLKVYNPIYQAVFDQHWVDSSVEYINNLEDKTDYLYEAKLIIIGEGGAGKTTLAKKIENPDYQLRNDEKSTEGIDVIQWQFSLDNDRDFKVNIWDFGGQEIYYATHQFFLTKRSLYILVADTSKEDTDFYYWLNAVELLSDNSPLIIITNEKDNRQRKVNERTLKAQFPNLKNILATNLATNKGLDEIIRQIKDQMLSLSHIGSAFPKNWTKVRKILEEDNRNYISLYEYLQICEDNGLLLHQDKLQLISYLHDLGVCFHFQDEEDSLLYRIVILKPKWGTDAVYKVLDNMQIINNHGYFTRKDLKTIWHEEKYAERRGELLELMNKFQLCYQIPDKKDAFIAPQLLSVNQPEYDWNESNNLILRYAYLDFMPKGIINRFIAIMHQYIYQQKYVWKTGVILNKDNTKVEVIEDYATREIRIRVVGNNKRNFMTIVTYELDKLNDSYNRLKYQKLIPCNCKTCKNSQTPYSYVFNNLLERIANRKFTIECGNPPYYEVQVLSLIDNAIDIKQMISNDKQDINKSFDFQGDIKQLVFQLLEQGDISGNFREERNTNISQDNYNELIEGNYYEQQGNNTLSNITQSHYGSGDNVGIDKNITNIYNSQDLTQAAAEIQALLERLEKTHPSKTTLGKMAIATEAIQQIDSDPKLGLRIISALKAGGSWALESLLNHPAASFIIAGLEDWQQSKK